MGLSVMPKENVGEDSSGQNEAVLRALVRERLANGGSHLYAEAVEIFDRWLLIQVLRHTAGNQLRAAQLLGITRGCLRKKIHKLGIKISRSVEPLEARP